MGSSPRKKFILPGDQPLKLKSRPRSYQLTPGVLPFSLCLFAKGLPAVAGGRFSAIPARANCAVNIFAAAKQSQSPLDRSRTIPYLRRITESIALSGNNRLAHFATVASGVTPYRALGVGTSIAFKITRAQSSAVVFDFFLALVATANA